MKPLNETGLTEGLFEPLEGSSFRFACHRDVSCFNRCCGDLNLGLTPYDVLRLKRHLGLPSDEFLDRFTEIDSGDRFPKVCLRMTEGPGRPCPFVTTAGCSVYAHRPGACRIYPLGRGSASGGRELYFLVKEDHCLGFQQDKTWVVGEWLDDQGLVSYNQSNDRFMEIITAKASLGGQADLARKLQMFLMATYNLDRFRVFILKSRFLDKFEVDQHLVENLKKSDETLLNFSYTWLKFALYGEKTMKLRSSTTGCDRLR